ncbi:STAS domain-containing protein [Micromonospora tulbaghiae]|uniref:Anti-anti-sigma factor n=1 Tax=Micromonospora tulbaghiae TaxID=479978 RepID=A0AAW4JF95_9ACTN|nr:MULTISPECIES: STAS domain-containing protein [Micromonospora]KAB1908097.1 STAS domain-containing protein [Micromonospora sp. AMSO1212t]MBO4138705.1 STAS domain-containing protein [Micromonospora tulbaghiae]MDX5458251.1 STAS domain-containing protein [Micromonospora tulbaghiae]SCE75482.1 anti-anti-sigma factor [Micromonospora tulbaghiae]
MSTSLTLTTSDSPDGARVLAAVGEIDMSNASAFADALAEAVRPDGEPLVVDLTKVEYLDSAGLAALFPHAGRIALIAGPLLEPLLTISGLADLTTVRSA